MSVKLALLRKRSLVTRKTALTFPNLCRRFGGGPPPTRQIPGRPRPGGYVCASNTRKRGGDHCDRRRWRGGLRADARGQADRDARGPHAPSCVAPVIRRTIHVIRHEHAAHFPAPRGAVATGGRVSRSRQPRPQPAPAGRARLQQRRERRCRPRARSRRARAARTRGPGERLGTPSAGAARPARAVPHTPSPARPRPRPRPRADDPVTTRSSSAAHAVSGTSAPAPAPATDAPGDDAHERSLTRRRGRARTAPARIAPGHDRTSGGASHSSSGGSVKTRASGGGEGEDHGDGGGDGGGDD